MHISARSSRTAAWIAIPLAVVASAAVIATASYSAFSATSERPDNTWNTAGVTLVDLEAGSAVFTADNLIPGDTGEQCVAVAAANTRDALVKLYSADSSDGGALAEHIALKVERGSAGENCDSFTAEETVLDGTLADLQARTSFADGLGSWEAPAVDRTADPIMMTTQYYRFTYTVAADTPSNSWEGSTAKTTFVWESQLR